jgi:hypothetical protein
MVLGLDKVAYLLDGVSVVIVVLCAGVIDCRLGRKGVSGLTDMVGESGREIFGIFGVLSSEARSFGLKSILREPGRGDE